MLTRIKTLITVKSILSTIQFIIILALGAGMYVSYQEYQRIKTELVVINESVNAANEKIDDAISDISDLSSSVSTIDDVQNEVRNLEYTISNIESDVSDISDKLLWGY